MSTLLIGPNFSGRSHWLADRRRDKHWPDAAFLGALADSTCTGLAWTVREELAIAAVGHSGGGKSICGIAQALGLENLLNHELHALSGGEAVRIALASAATQRIRELHVDTALEQLDSSWRTRIISLLTDPSSQTFEAVFVADNHLTTDEISRFNESIQFPQGENDRHRRTAFMTPTAAIQYVSGRPQIDIAVRDVSFAYPATKQRVFEGVSLTLVPGIMHFLVGPNGSGKSTFVKLLSGTILPEKGELFYGSERFNAKKTTVRRVALAFQNPDYQWTAQSVDAEISRARSEATEGLSNSSEILPSFGIPSDCIKENPVELPFVLKKRLGVALAFLSGKPWLVLDEPTLGQDSRYREDLAALIEGVLATGMGVIAISHDTYFRSLFPQARKLQIGDRNVVAT